MLVGGCGGACTDCRRPPNMRSKMLCADAGVAAPKISRLVARTPRAARTPAFLLLAAITNPCLYARLAGHLRTGINQRPAARKVAPAIVSRPPPLRFRQVSAAE